MGDIFAANQSQLRATPVGEAVALLQMQVLMDRHPDDFLEPLAIRLDHAGRLVEKNALDAKERHEHRDEIEARFVSASELPHPVLERIEVDRAHREAGR